MLEPNKQKKKLQSTKHNKQQMSRANNTMKVLTVFSVIMLPLSVITGFYGMNLQPLPFVSTESPVLVVSLIMLGVAVAMLVYFKIRKWI